MFNVFKKFHTDKDTIPGAKVVWGRKLFPMVKEYYLTRETKQRFRVLGIPIYIRTGLQTAHFPSEMMTLLDYLRDKDLTKMTTKDLVDGYRELMLDQTVKTGDMLLKKASDYDCDDQGKIVLTKALKDATAHTLDIFTADMSRYTEVTDLFTKQGCVPLYVVGGGAFHRLYLVKLIDNMLVFYIVDVTGPLKNGIHLSRIETFHLTEQVIKAHNAHTDKKGVL